MSSLRRESSEIVFKSLCWRQVWITREEQCRLKCTFKRGLAVSVLAGVMQTTLAFAESMEGSAFTDPTLTWHEVPAEWITQSVQPEPESPEADLAITLDQQIYPPLLPLIQQYAAARQVRYLRDRMVPLDTKFAMVAASKLR